MEKIRYNNKRATHYNCIKIANKFALNMYCVNFNNIMNHSIGSFRSSILSLSACMYIHLPHIFIYSRLFLLGWNMAIKKLNVCEEFCAAVGLRLEFLAQFLSFGIHFRFRLADFRRKCHIAPTGIENVSQNSIFVPKLLYFF